MKVADELLAIGSRKHEMTVGCRHASTMCRVYCGVVWSVTVKATVTGDVLCCVNQLQGGPSRVQQRCRSLWALGQRSLVEGGRIAGEADDKYR